VYNHLTTLQETKFVVKDGDTYSLSLQFLMLGEYVRNQNTLYQIGKPEIDTLAAETGEYAHLSTEQHGLGVNLYKLPGDKAVGTDYQTSKLQKPDYLHFSATGKAILAYLPDERVDEIIDRYGLVRKTANTITDRDELFAERERIREQGYATNDEEEIEGLRAIGAPILDREGDVLGSLSVSGPTNRMHDETYHEEIVERVVNAANVIEVNINMSHVSTEFPDLH
jgi:DNA-binding IclR family transcriptional regulator